VTVPIRHFLRHRAKLLAADVTRIDLAGRKVHFSVFEDPHDEPLSYDHLVLALGSDTLYPDVPGLREHSYPMKSLGDALRLRDRAIQLLERAHHCDDADCARALLRFVVVGGGPTGVETAGEFQQFLRRAARSYPNLDPSYVSMTLVDHASRILRGFDEELSDWAAKHLRGRGIDLRLNESVAEVTPTHVRLASGETLECHTTIWAAGIAPPALLATLDLPKDKRGYVLCDPDTRVHGHANVWAVGDCASNPGPDGKPFPALAQHALGEGTQCGRNIARALRNQTTHPVKLRTKGMIAAFGHGDAVAKVFFLKLTGFPAWFLYRTVYLMKMPGLGRKVRVALDWTLDLVFRPEPTSLGLLPTSRRAVAAGAPTAGRTRDDSHPVWPGAPDHPLAPDRRADVRSRP
jgi:NADH:ubiquinone reductase (H+-translocating)